MTSRREIRRSLRTNFNPGLRDRLSRVALRTRQGVHVPELVFGRELDRPIFVIGAPRSGTSLLHSILVTSRHVAHWTGEAHEVWEADHHPALRGWSSNVLEADDALADPAAAARIRREFFLVTGSRKRFVDKNPRNSLRISFVDALFPDARYVFLARDGRDNVNSLINAWRTPRYRTYELPEPHSIPGVDPRWWKFVLYPGWSEDRNGPLEVVCAKQWRTCNENCLEGERRLATDRWIRIGYEDLVGDAVREAARLFAFLELPFDDEVRRRAAATADTPVNVVTPPERGKWRRENGPEIERVLPLIAPTMEALGYAPDAEQEEVAR